jgi:integrase
MGQVSLGVGPDGKRRRKAVYAATRAEARKRMREVRLAHESGEQVATDGRTTLAAWIERYTSTSLESSVAAGRIKRSTAEWHTAMLKRAEPLARKRLEALRPSDIEAWVLGLEGAASTVRGAFTALSRCLDVAVRDGLLSRNPCASVDRPSGGSAEAVFLDMAQVRALIDACDPWMRAAVLVMATTGIRRGELLALRWADIDLAAGTLRVTGTVVRTKTDGLVRTAPKSAAGIRTVPLPPVAVKALRRGLPHAPVFPSEAGGWVEPRNFSRRFAKVAAAAGLPHATPHALRHSAATAMIAAGVPVPVVSDMLGHGDIRVTVGTYTHVIDQQRRAASDALAAALGG